MPDQHARTRPISILAPQIHLINAGLLHTLLRPAGGMLDQLRPGDLLWVREAFALPRQFDNVSPTQAAAQGARPLFTTGEISGHLQPGRPRFARELPRAWHRQHLVVASVDRVWADTICRSDMALQGYAMPECFVADWNRNLSLARSASRWEDNPEVLMIGFQRIYAPLPEMRHAV